MSSCPIAASTLSTITQRSESDTLPATSTLQLSEPTMSAAEHFPVVPGPSLASPIPPGGADSPMQPGIIAGIAVAGGTFLLIVTIVLWMACCRRVKAPSQQATNPTNAHTSDHTAHHHHHGPYRFGMGPSPRGDRHAAGATMGSSAGGASGGGGGGGGGGPSH